VHLLTQELGMQSRKINMPFYDFECENCNKVTEEMFSIAKRPSYIPCPNCGGKAIRIISRRVATNAESRVMWSKAFGIHPDQIPEMEQRFPGDKYHPVSGAMRIKGYQHQKQIAKRLGMIID